MAAVAAYEDERLIERSRQLGAALLAQLQSGPIVDGLWTLLVSQPAVAAKLRQWVPAVQAHVRSKGWPIERVEVKIHRV